MSQNIDREGSGFQASGSAAELANGLATRTQPWVQLNSIAEVELWIAEHDRALQQLVGKSPTTGHGVCFELAAGGAVYLHTTGDGDIILDVEPEAAWIAPVINAATAVRAPATQIWLLPNDVLTQLIFGLNPLIASAQLVTDHRFRGRQTFR